jgi:putative endonuclease
VICKTIEANCTMPFFVYILYSESLDQYYVGHTMDLDDRLWRHRNSGSKSTKKANDWQIVYKKPYSSRSLAFQKEIEIKKKKSRVYIEQLIGSCG